MTHTAPLLNEPEQRSALDIAIAVAISDPQLRKPLMGALERVSARLLEENAGGELEEVIAMTERLRPAILFLGLTGLSVDITVAMARIAKLDSPPKVVAVHDHAQPESILKAMRAGVIEFIHPPFETAIEETMERILTVCSQPGTDLRTTGSLIGFLSVKGGCGATTIACHAASWLRGAGRKEVLLADLDTSAGIAGLLMQAPARYTLDDALHNLHRLDPKLWKALVTASPSGVDVIPPPVDEPTVFLNGRKLPQMFRFWRMQYNCTLMDLGHGLTPALIETLESLDQLVLVTTNEVLPLRQAKQTIQTLVSHGLGAHRIRLVINRMPKRTALQIPELEKALGHPVYATLPNDYKTLNDAYSEPKLMDLQSELGRSIGELAGKLTGLTPVAKKPRGLFGLRKGS